MHKLAELCVKRPVFATMLIVALMVVGVFSFFTLGVDLFPKIDLPTVSVSVSNPGASAEEVETEITKRMEDAVNTISGIDSMNSTSVEGTSTVVITFELDKNGDVGAQEMRDKVNLIVNDLPETAKAPVVQKFDPDATPIMQIALSSPRPLREVTEIADKQIKPQLENINGVGQIQLVGGLKREIRVWVDPDKMRAYNLAISDVANALKPAEHGNAGRQRERGRARTGRPHAGPPGGPGAVQRDRHRNAWLLRGEAARYRPRGGFAGRADHRRAAEWRSGRDHGGVQTIRTEHRGGRRCAEGAASKQIASRCCPKTSTSRSSTISPSSSRPPCIRSKST